MSKEPSWPHAPCHLLGEGGAFFVTAATYQHECLFSGRARLEVLHRGLLEVAETWGWRLEAWAVFANHYHFVGHSPSGEHGAESLRTLLGELHERSAKWVNRLDGASGRRCWFNYWDTRLTFEKSYFARLSYTHRNPVRHGLVREARDYPWCSARWFEERASAAQRRTVESFRGSGGSQPDAFEVPHDW